MTTTWLRHRCPSVLALSSVILLLSGCGQSRHTEQAAADRARPVAVRVVTAAASERTDRIEAGGVVAAAETAVISSRVVAPVTSVAVRAGDRVRAGDVLVRLDAEDMTARAAQARSATRAAEEALAAARSAQTAAAADHKLAAAWHARITQLRERNSATPQEFDEADARLSAAAARTAEAQSRIEQATAQLASTRAAGEVATITEAYAVIRAPFDGEVTERLIDPGNLATPGQPLLRVDASGRRRVEVRVDEARAAYVRPGDRVGIVLDNTVGENRRPALEGIVVEVARAIAADQRAFTVKVALPDGLAPRTGAFARLRFAGPRRRAVMVPSSAVRVRGQLTSVFVVNSGAAQIRLVQTGTTDGDRTEIVAGLDAGESIVDMPPVNLNDGSLVTIITSPSPGASP